MMLRRGDIARLKVKSIFGRKPVFVVTNADECSVSGISLDRGSRVDAMTYQVALVRRRREPKQ